MLSNATNQPKSTVELGYMCPRGLSGQKSERKRAFDVNYDFYFYLLFLFNKESLVLCYDCFN